MRHLPTLVAVAALAGATVLSGCAGDKKDAGSDSAAVKVAVVYSKTGLLAAYGKEYLEGFQAGMDYATKGTNAVDGHPIEVTYADDTGDPAKAVTAAKQYRQRLAPYKVPREIVFVEELPRSSVGKMLRRQLRKGAR